LLEDISNYTVVHYNIGAFVIDYSYKVPNDYSPADEGRYEHTPLYKIQVDGSYAAMRGRTTYISQFILDKLVQIENKLSLHLVPTSCRSPRKKRLLILNIRANCSHVSATHTTSYTTEMTGVSATSIVGDGCASGHENSKGALTVRS